MVKRVRTPKANRESTTRFPSSVTGIGGQAFVRFGICFHLAPIPFPHGPLITDSDTVNCIVCTYNAT
jgi:hypothetical protein